MDLTYEVQGRPVVITAGEVDGRAEGAGKVCMDSTGRGLEGDLEPGIAEAGRLLDRVTYSKQRTTSEHKVRQSECFSRP